MIDRETLRLKPSKYFHQAIPKDLIVLHFTAGASCFGAWKHWQSSPGHIATAYGVDPNGTVHEFFPPELWAFHLGVRGGRRHDQRSIGIEIANVGPLKLAGDGETLCFWPKDYAAAYCRLDETDRYVKKSYRGMDYWAAMPAEQQAATGKLVVELCQKFRIPFAWAPKMEAGEFCLADVAGHAGIATHANFRRDKFDVGPAFDWDFLRRAQ